MKSNCTELAKYITEINIRNSDLAITNLLGVSMEKTFISSVANLNGVDLSVYKVLRKDQLACKLMSVGRDEKLPVDLYKDENPAIVSSAYYVFEPKDKEVLLPEYLMMWLCRPENDRYIGFISGGDVRGGISWESFCSLPIKVPKIDKQREIVKEYNVIQNRIALNQQLIKKLEETAQTIYKQWFLEFEFPDENGKPYKSNGGEMVESELGEIPKGWEVVSIKDFCKEMKSGGTPSRDNTNYWNTKDIAWLKTGEVCNRVLISSEEYISFEGCKNSSAKVLPINSVLIAMYGQGKTKGQAGYLRFEATTNQACCAMICENEFESTFLYYFLRINQSEIASLANGGAQPNLSKELIESIRIFKPLKEHLNIHRFVKFINHSEVLERENQKLTELKEFLLSKLATVEY
ncbi:MAG: restriction endonuclease subunit S [Bacteroidales bacterium]